jgi:hypothetical protein
MERIVVDLALLGFRGLRFGGIIRGFRGSSLLELRKLYSR